MKLKKPIETPKDLEFILNTLKKEFRVDLTDDLSRARYTVNVRTIYAYLSDVLTPHSYTLIGAVIGKDHASILHLKRKYRDWVKWDSRFLLMAERVRSMISEDILLMSYEDQYEFHKKRANELKKLISLSANERKGLDKVA